MEKDKGQPQVKKGFFARLWESLDQKMEEKAKAGGCGCCSGAGKDKAC